nr:unnamed protein product [Callosobruchus analis]
MRVFIEQQ